LVVRVSTELDTSADAAWNAVKRIDTFRYVTRGVLDYRTAQDTPAELREGMVVRGRLFFFHVLPTWRHEIRVARVDDGTREIRTTESGGPVTKWGHRISIEPRGERARYTDEIEIAAGVLTPLVWLYAQVFYRYRQARWQRLARKL